MLLKIFELIRGVGKLRVLIDFRRLHLAKLGENIGQQVRFILGLSDPLTG